MLFEFQETSDLEVLRRLHAETFPSDEEPDYTLGRWWVALHGDAPVAFVGVDPVDETHAYLSRVGVLPAYRGLGLQRDLMQLAERHTSLAHPVMVSTTYDNPPSANNFIRLGYLTYEPTTRWGAEGTCYWIKSLF